jgi:hypothetical protein
VSDDGELIENPMTGERFRFLECSEEVTRLDWWLDPGRRAPQHIHPRQEERVTGVSGQLRIDAEDGTHLCGSGDVVPIPPGVKHDFRNDGSEPAHMIVEFRPALRSREFFIDVARLGRASQSRRRRSLRTLLEAMALGWVYRHDFRLARPLLMQWATLPPAAVAAQVVNVEPGEMGVDAVEGDEEETGAEQPAGSSKR